MHIKQRNGKYVLDYYVKVKGILRRREETFPTRRLAELAMAKRRVEVAEGKFLDVRRRPVADFEEVVEKYLKWAKGNKVSWDRDALSLTNWKKELKVKKLSEISTLDVERFKLKRRDKVAPRTVNEELNCLRRFFYRAMDWGLADSNPVKGVRRLREPPGRMKILSPDEAKKLLDACGPGLRPIVILALHTGMRRGEILGLKWGDVDFNRGVILVRRSKNGESREIPMTKTLREALSGLPRVSDTVFTSSKGGPYRSIRNAFNRAVREAGFAGLRFHDLRHVFASNLRMGGADLFLLQELLGHKTLAMTMRYAHITCSRKREVMGVLDGEFLESRFGGKVPEGIDKEAKVL